jgi:Resolvase, N terminal domain
MARGSSNLESQVLSRTLMLCSAQGGIVRVAIYARVSTDQQSPEMQLGEVREYCRRRQWDVAGEFIDHAVSGARESRPALNKLWTEARRRRFDGMVFTAMTGSPDCCGSWSALWINSAV